MNQNYKVEKQKKHFNWEAFKKFFRTIYSNDAAFHAGLENKWFVAVIIAFVSIIISVIPLTVHAATASGSQFVNSTYVYNYDEGFYSFLEDANSKGYSITFDSTTSSAKLSGVTLSSSNNYLLYEHTATVSDNHSTSKVDFQVFYLPENVNFSTTLSTIAALGVNSTSGRDASYLVFSNKYFASALFKPGSYTSVGGVNGDYTHLNSEYTSLKYFYVTSNSTPNENSTASLNLFQGFMDAVYINNRTTYTWLQLGIISAVNSCITLLMGLVLFLMTRGKNNPNRVIKFQQCFNIAYWTALTPAILALILGFIFSGYEIMLYVIIYGFRVMWLSMKTLSPTGPTTK